MDLYRLKEIVPDGTKLLGIATSYEGAAALLQLVAASYVGSEPVQNSPCSGRIFYPEIIRHAGLEPTPFVPQKTYVELGAMLFAHSFTARRDPIKQPADMGKGWEMRWAIVEGKMIAFAFAVWVSDKVPEPVPAPPAA